MKIRLITEAEADKLYIEERIRENPYWLSNGKIINVIDSDDGFFEETFYGYGDVYPVMELDEPCENNEIRYKGIVFYKMYDYWAEQPIGDSCTYWANQPIGFCCSLEEAEALLDKWGQEEIREETFDICASIEKNANGFFSGTIRLYDEYSHCWEFKELCKEEVIKEFEEIFDYL